MAPYFPIDYRRRVVEPMNCLKAGWDLISSQYWLFVGMTLVGMLIASLVPFAILLGPMMCGIYLALFSSQRGAPIEFGTLLKGFDYFGPSLVATLLHMVPIIVILLPFYVVMFAGPLLIAATQNGDQVNPAMPILFIVVLAMFGIALLALMVFVGVGFTFVYPLIVDRKLAAMAAVRLSIKAALANFWRILGLMLLNGVLGMAGALLCCIGFFLVLPVNFASVSIAYRQVFGLRENEPSMFPPPPPTFTKQDLPESLR